ncbi:uncharacterized protein TNCV_2797801 [Trichonephila clavipes]|nr:uncharacterized protein TNCV_2797801 [Trichonephila clavipes]
MNKIPKTPAGLNCSIVLSEEFIAVGDDNVCTAPIMADKDILEFLQSSKNIIDPDSDNENEMNNAAPYSYIIRNEERHEKKVRVRYPMPPNTFRVQTEYGLIKSVVPKVLRAESRVQETGEYFPPPSVPCLNCGGGDRWCRHLSSLRGDSPS